MMKIARGIQLRVPTIVSRFGNNNNTVKSAVVRTILNQSAPALITRTFSTEPPKADGTPKEPIDKQETTASDKKEVANVDYDEYDDYDYDEPKTAKEKMRVYGIIGARLFFLCAGLYCIYVVGGELFPGRMHPQSLFSEAADVARARDEVLAITGESPVAFGRDTGRNTEGRRNHVDSYKYVEEDGSNRLRIRFNVKGRKGQVRVWAEVSDKMEHGQYVYIICQNVKNGRVVTLIDNRDELEAKMNTLSGDSFLSKLFK